MVIVRSWKSKPDGPPSVLNTFQIVVFLLHRQ